MDIARERIIWTPRLSENKSIFPNIEKRTIYSRRKNKIEVKRFSVFAFSPNKASKRGPAEPWMSEIVFLIIVGASACTGAVRAIRIEPNRSENIT